jgi:hypothetical protein
MYQMNNKKFLLIDAERTFLTQTSVKLPSYWCRKLFWFLKMVKSSFADLCQPSFFTVQIVQVWLLLFRLFRSSCYSCCTVDLVVRVIHVYNNKWHFPRFRKKKKKKRGLEIEDSHLLLDDDPVVISLIINTLM